MSQRIILSLLTLLVCACLVLSVAAIVAIALFVR